MGNNIHRPWIDFRTAVLGILDEQEPTYTHSLEEYLISFWEVTTQYKAEPVSYPFIISIIKEVFATKPMPFNTQWLLYENELFWEWDDEQGFYFTKIPCNERWEISETNVDPYYILEHTLLLQIADLHLMRDRQLKDPYRYYGVDSPTGHRWYNFDVFTYWECATRGMDDHMRSSGSLIRHRFNTCTWATLALLLELGSTYE